MITPSMIAPGAGGVGTTAGGAGSGSTGSGPPGVPVEPDRGHRHLDPGGHAVWPRSRRSTRGSDLGRSGPGGRDHLVEERHGGRLGPRVPAGRAPGGHGGVLGVLTLAFGAWPTHLLGGRVDDGVGVGGGVHPLAADQQLVLVAWVSAMGAPRGCRGRVVARRRLTPRLYSSPRRCRVAKDAVRGRLDHGGAGGPRLRAGRPSMRSTNLPIGPGRAGAPDRHGILLVGRRQRATQPPVAAPAAGVRHVFGHRREPPSGFACVLRLTHRSDVMTAGHTCSIMTSWATRPAWVDRSERSLSRRRCRSRSTRRGWRPVG